MILLSILWKGYLYFHRWPREVYIAGTFYTEISLLVVVVAMMQSSVFKGLSVGSCLARYQYTNPV